MIAPAHQRYDTYLSNTHFGSLDGLRFLCISLVIWHHGPVWNQLEPLFFSRGHTGVDFFFILSGYLITTLLLREQDRTGQINLKAFYWRRILRIVPIYFFVVTLSAIYEIGVQGRTENLDLLPYYYLFLSNFIEGRDMMFLSPTWSLAMEEQFYMVWPVLMILTPTRWIVPLLAALIMWNVGVAVGFFDLLGITKIETGTLTLGIFAPTYAPILMGALTGVLLHYPTAFNALWRLVGFRTAPIVGLGLLAIAYAVLPQFLIGWPNLLMHTLMCLILVSLVIREDNALAPLLKWRPIARIGQISYGIYLYHLFALAVVAKGLEILGWQTMSIPGGIMLIGLYFLAAIVISEISFRTLEQSFMRFRKRGWGRTKTTDPGTS